MDLGEGSKREMDLGEGSKRKMDLGVRGRWIWGRGVRGRVMRSSRHYYKGPLNGAKGASYTHIQLFIIVYCYILFIICHAYRMNTDQETKGSQKD